MEVNKDKQITKSPTTYISTKNGILVIAITAVLAILLLAVIGGVMAGVVYLISVFAATYHINFIMAALSLVMVAIVYYFIGKQFTKRCPRIWQIISRQKAVKNL